MKFHEYCCARMLQLENNIICILECYTESVNIDYIDSLNSVMQEYKVLEGMRGICLCYDENEFYDVIKHFVSDYNENINDCYNNDLLNVMFRADMDIVHKLIKDYETEYMK